MATTNFTDNSTVILSSWLDDVDVASYSHITSVAGTNTITAAGPAGMTAYATGQRFTFIPANTNTGATTLNITPSGGSALGAKNVFCSNAALEGGELVAGVPALVCYDGTQFQLLNGSKPVFIGSVATTFTFNGSGGTTGSVTLRFQKIGKVVTIYFPAITGTSGTGSTLATSNTSMDSVFRPSATQTILGPVAHNNGVNLAGPAGLQVLSDGKVNIYRDGVATAYTNSSTCGIGSAGSVVYYTG